ncbi:MAG: ribosome maturation factor RimM [Clostridiales Family XIII bacterium]|nr:ribosome maturation factor RimM [Clostridiales Family XIII bacterium]
MTETNTIIKIGKITGAAGLRGEVKLFHDSGERERLAGIRELYLLAPGAREEDMRKTEVLALRYTGKTPVLTLAGVTDRSAAEALAGTLVYAELTALAPLEADAFYVEVIAGFSVVDAAGFPVGTVAGVLPNPAHDILRISLDGKAQEALLPFVDVFVSEVDAAGRVIRITPPEGWPLD